MAAQADLNDVEQLAPDEPLTTKEGWRRFVTHQPTPPVFPNAAELTAFSARVRAVLVQARRGYHSDLPLAYTQVMRKLLATGRLLVQLNRGQISARRGMNPVRRVGHRQDHGAHTAGAHARTRGPQTASRPGR